MSRFIGDRKKWTVEDIFHNYKRHPRHTYFMKWIWTWTICLKKRKNPFSYIISEWFHFFPAWFTRKWDWINSSMSFVNRIFHCMACFVLGIWTIFESETFWIFMSSFWFCQISYILGASISSMIGFHPWWFLLHFSFFWFVIYLLNEHWMCSVKILMSIIKICFKNRCSAIFLCVDLVPLKC